MTCTTRTLRARYRHEWDLIDLDTVMSIPNLPPRAQAHVKAVTTTWNYLDRLGQNVPLNYQGYFADA